MGKKATKKTIKKSAAPAKQKPRKKAANPPRWSEQEVREAFSRFERANPHPKGELEHVNDFTLLVAVVLSAQATDAGVNKATRALFAVADTALFAVADTPEKMAALGEEKLRDYIKTIGLYKGKAKNVIALSNMLKERHRAFEYVDREARLQSSANARRASGATGRGAQDRECRFEYRLWRADARGRYACLSREQPHRSRAGEKSARGRTGTGSRNSGALQDTCASLADLAWALHVSGAKSEMPYLHHQ